MRSLNESTRLIRDEHKKLKGLFRQLEAIELKNPSIFHPVVDEACDELQSYLEREQKLLFPSVERAMTAQTHRGAAETEFIHQILAQSLDDHRDILATVREVRALRTEPLASDWNRRIEDLVTITEAYFNAEEKSLLPFIEKRP